MYYEIKYDGFRCLLYIDEEEIDLYSRNLISLRTGFPEIVKEATRIQNEYNEDLPILLDGELCVLESDIRASFSQIQKRGRLKNIEKIQQHTLLSPVTYLVFDLLVIGGKPLKSETYINRKQQLQSWMNKMSYPTVNHDFQTSIQWIPPQSDGESLFNQVKSKKGEGIVAKRKNSLWISGKRTPNWLKVKRLFRGFFIVTGFDEGNGYVHIAVIKDKKLEQIGLFSHGLEGKDREALIQIVQNNQKGRKGTLIKVSPGICVELEFLELYNMQLRHPRFVQFRLDIHWEDCTWEALQTQMDS
ncbi:RNA ligase family protein [Pseudalkalibacillus berkeleyi]|uniref:ATP-dependent DNA ligase family profile domain-containing protein n=1 Tax=Pseudalkalibacillus berkeleyi TaxID=1069813 RepID=A0ABS9GVS3_9BACL|nr:RNA ligase family protein [Pseudalkalibacillus berkeleyi]MCF6136794.1 hypothetical protein [Pseudalkalibacillus berkeleyi]